MAAPLHSPAYPTLSPGQQSLLLAALSSNRSKTALAGTMKPSSPAVGTDKSSAVDLTASAADDFNDQDFNAAAFDQTFDADDAFNDSAFAEFADGDASAGTPYDFSNEKFDNAFPASSASGEYDPETGDKRKLSPLDDDDDDDELDPKRRDGEDKVSKKPGRKPLTSEPTTKRKAQNRAAQRAFRERKEKHLKDLEQKVSDLEKASESANHENGLLRAQVDRLQTELRDYRKRLSMNSSSGPAKAPPVSKYTPWEQRSNSAGALGPVDFNFDFPRFGGLPGSQLPNANKYTNSDYASALSGSPVNTASPANSALNRQNSRSLSPATKNQTYPGAKAPFRQGSNGPLSGNVNDSLGNIFNQTLTNDYSSSASPEVRNFQNNSRSRTNTTATRSASTSGTSNATSPASSVSQNPGATSSCATSPEPCNASPNYGTLKGNKDQNVNGNSSYNFNNQKGTSNNDLSFDWLASQNGGSFDPVLFGDYRESQDAIIGGGDFSGGFFDDSFSNFDDPFNFSINPDVTIPASSGTNPPKTDLMQQVDKNRDGEAVCMPFKDPEQRQLLTAHKIWNTLQSCPKFKSGDFDIDSLCTELQTKAKCSETGVVVPREDVEAALWRLAGEPPTTRVAFSAE